MTRDRSAKRAARARKASTGEPYARARRLTEPEDPDLRSWAYGLSHVLPTYSPPSVRTVNLRVTLGTKPAGGWVETELSNDIPHLLVTGGAGSGKTTVLASIVAQLAASNSPVELEMGLVGPRLSLWSLRHLPHVVHHQHKLDRGQAGDYIRLLAWDVERRIEMLAQSQAWTLEHLREQAFSDDSPRPLSMPYRLAVFDDLHLLLSGWPATRAAQAQREAMVANLRRVALFGRAAGVRLVLATEPLAAGVLPEEVEHACDLVRFPAEPDGEPGAGRFRGRREWEPFRSLAV